MNDARERARDALAAYGRWLRGEPQCLPAGVEWAAIVRDLLAVTPGAPGTWAWAVEQMRAGRKVRRSGWEDSGYCELRELQVFTVPMYLEERVRPTDLADFDATDWEVVPPPAPAIKPGTAVKARWGKMILYGYYLRAEPRSGHTITMFDDGSGQEAFVNAVEPLAGGTE